MKKISRRSVFKAAAAGSLAVPLAAQNEHEDEDEDEHQRPAIAGRRASATVSFGAWGTDPPLNRFADPLAGTGNQHRLIPNEVKIKAGGSVNFVIAGFHLVAVYGNGTQPANIDVTKLVMGAPLIDDPNNRVYMGLDPRTQPRDRVEVVHFPHPGTYLVICGVLFHFNEGMFGFVKVRPAEPEM